MEAEILQLDKEKKGLDTVASVFARFITDRGRAKSAYDDGTTAACGVCRAKLETEREDAERRIQGLPWLDEIHRLRREIMELESLPETFRKSGSSRSAV